MPSSGTDVGLSPLHVRDYVIRPVLDLLPFSNAATAERLLLGTAAQESRFRYLKQLGKGPALGLWQMEPITFRDLWDRFSVRYSLDRFLVVTEERPQLQLTWNLRFAAVMCRVHYFARPFTMPETASAEDLGLIWKGHYNTRLGKGKVSEFVENYRRFVEPIYE